jgi:hypothetical protein
MSINEELRAALQPPVSDWVEAFNAHDVAAIVALYTDDAELFDAGMRYPRRGRDEIERWFSHRFASMPSITYTPTAHAFMVQDRAAVTWTTSGRSPRLLGQAWLSRPFQVDGVSIFTLCDGLIYRQRGYYDHLSVLEQVLPLLRWLLHVVRL